MSEVKQHQTEGSMWTVLKGRVYNIYPYMKFHPGGMHTIIAVSLLLFTVFIIVRTLSSILPSITISYLLTADMFGSVSCIFLILPELMLMSFTVYRKCRN